MVRWNLYRVCQTLTVLEVNRIGLAGASTLYDSLDFNQMLFILTLRGAIVKGLHEVLTKVAPPVCTRCVQSVRGAQACLLWCAPLSQSASNGSGKTVCA